MGIYDTRARFPKASAALVLLHMDVTCTRCNTVYEIEGAAPSGMTVKCTQCGHLFKVRGGVTTTPTTRSDPPAAPTAKWRVRKPDGSVHALESLTELSRAIIEGRFEESDEISGTGQAWKRLGDIAELSVFFVRERISPPPRPVAAVLPRSESSLTPRDREPSLPPPPPGPLRARKNTPWPEPEFNVMGAPVNADGAPNAPSSAGNVAAGARVSAPPAPSTRPVRPRRNTPSPYAPASASEPSAVLAAGSATPVAAMPFAAEGASHGQVALAAGARLSPLAASAPAILAPAPAPAPAPVMAPVPAQPIAAPPRKARSYLWIAIGLPLVLAAGIGGAWLARKPWSAVPTHPAREFLLRGDEALAAHRLSRFEEAANEYKKALTFHEDDAHILSSLSRVYAVWSQVLRSRIGALRSENASAPEIALLEAESASHAQLAKTHGERAAQRNPGNVEAEVALADGLRLTGNLIAARAELNRARQAEPVPSAETLRVAAWLAIDEAAGDLRAGHALALEAVSRDPDLIRTRILLIEIEIAERDLDAARANVDKVRAVAADHPQLLELIRAIDRASRGTLASAGGAAGAAPLGSGGDVNANAPVADARKAHANGSAEASPDAPKPSDKGKPSDEGTIVSPEASLELVRRGERALEDGAVRQADDLFTQALALSPGSPSALTGLGYVALERGQTQVALRRFTPAARTGHGEALIGLGDTYRRIGRSEQALSSYESYVKRFPHGKRRSIAERQIELLREQLASPSGP